MNLLTHMETNYQNILVILVAFTLVGVVSTPSVLAEESEHAYAMDSDVNFHGVGWVMPGTTVPVSVTISKISEINSSHMIAIHFQTDGHEFDRSTSYIPSLDSTDTLEVQGEAYIAVSTTKLDIELEVLLCKDDPCDMNKSIDDRFENGTHSNQMLTIDSDLPEVVRLQGMTRATEDSTRFIFDFDETNSQSEAGFWSLTVSANEEELPIQGMNLCINWIDSSGAYNQEIWNLANRTVYGFNPTNSESRVTFFDILTVENGNAVANFDTGDIIYIRSQDDGGTILSDFGMSLAYDFSSLNSGAILGSWGDGCSHDWDNDGASASDAFPFDSREQLDSDMDGVGDNTDAFPNDPDEIFDSDGDGVGDNSDAYPNDETKSSDEEEDEDSEDALPSIGIVASLSMCLLAMILAVIRDRD